MTTYKEGRQLIASANAAERVVDIPSEVFWLEKDLTPLLHLAAGNEDGRGGFIGKREAINPEFKVIEKEPHSEWTAINNAGTAYTGGATVLVVDTVANIRPGYMAVNVVSNEHVRITAKSTGDSSITVVRAQGATTADTMANNDPLLILGDASEEDSSVPTILLVQNRIRTNYLETIRVPAGISRRARESEMYGGKKIEEIRTEAMIEWKKQCERKFLFGEPYYNATGGPNGNAISNTGGIYYWATTGGGQVTTATTTFTRTMWATFVRSCFLYGSDTKILLAAPLIIEMLEAFKDGKLQFRPSEEFYNLRVAEWETGFGRLIIKPHRMLKNSPYGTTTAGYGGLAIAFGADILKYRYLRNSDVKLYENIVRDGKDGQTDDIMGDVGLQLVNPETVAILESVSTYSAA